MHSGQGSGLFWMAKARRALFGAAALMVAAAVSAGVEAAGVRVIDGDTLEVGAETIRLWGIDAPEDGQTCWRAKTSYDCGAEALAALSRLVSGRAVRCEARYKDRYGRTVARCFITGGVDLGGELVRQGWALDYERYSKGHYRQDQAKAKDEGHGLWSGTFAPPWQWRHRSSKQ